MGSADANRYVGILALVVVVAGFTVVASDGPDSRAVVAAMFGVLLVAAISGADMGRAARSLVLATVVIAIVGTVVLATVDGDQEWLPNGVASVLIVATVGELVRGLIGHLKREGVTVAAIAGGLAIYILVGLLFASVIGVIADLDSNPYFAGGREAVMSERVYFSFTTMTTTGFGDPVAATRAGKSLAVLEMLIGQIYLVTVIALLVSRARPGPRLSGD